MQPKWTKNDMTRDYNYRYTSCFSVHYQERLLAIKAFMKERHLDEEIQKRVVDYLCILWEKHK